MKLCTSPDTCLHVPNNFGHFSMISRSTSTCGAHTSCKSVWAPMPYSLKIFEPHLEEVFCALDLVVLVLVIGHIDVYVFPPMFYVDQALQQRSRFAVTTVHSY